MLTIEARNVNEAYNQALWTMMINGEEYHTRNGAAIRAPCPVTTIYRRPAERVLFDPKRDANPFFHVMESIWMMAGREDVEYVAKFNSTIGNFSDDGVILRGAYGYRWRKWFGHDQLGHVVEELKRDPNSRRAVIAMYDGFKDASAVQNKSRDIPCNTTIYFVIRSGRLDMTVCNRSNDIVWGCYGANAVHMSFLMEYIAHQLIVEMGKYYQVSNDWHIYERHFPLIENRSTDHVDYYPFGDDDTIPFDVTLQECEKFCRWSLREPHSELGYVFKSDFLRLVAMPMYRAWLRYKKSDLEGAKLEANTIKSIDWRIACDQWLKRRIK